jgi:DNA-binding XRE family transcriptional regulator
VTRGERTERNERIRELRYMEGMTCDEVGRLVGLTHGRVSQIAPGCVRVYRNERIRELRYMDGLSTVEVARRYGLSRYTVRRIAPGRPGKIDNAAAREAFLRSGKSASAVARDLGWGSGRRPEASRVLRTLGVTLSRDGRGVAQYRRFVDSETLGRIAESIGVEPWEVGCCD